MENKDLSQEVLKKIKKEKINPKSKWLFLLKNYLVWVTGLAFVLIGGLASAVLVYLISNNDWDVYLYLENNFISFVFKTIPYFWVIFLALFVWAADYNFKQTKKGYRYKLRVVVLGTVLASFLMGFFFYDIGLGQIIDQALAEKIPAYQNVTHRRKSVWIQQEKGLLAGLIVSIKDEKNIEIMDFEKKNWKVNLEKAEPIDQKTINLKPGMTLKMIGQKTAEDVFEAHKFGLFIKSPGFLFKKNKAEIFPKSKPVNLNERKPAPLRNNR